MMNADTEAKIHELTKTNIIVPGMSDNEIIGMIKGNYSLIRQLDPKSKIVEAAIRKYPHAILRMDTEYEHLWIIAVENGSSIITLCKNLTEAICVSYAKCKFSYPSLIPVYWRTKAVCIEFVKQSHANFVYVPTALKYNVDIIRVMMNGGNPSYISNVPFDALTEQLCIEYVRKYPGSFYLLPVQHESVCKLAIQMEPSNIMYVWDQTPELKKYAIDTVGAGKLLLQWMKHQDDETVKSIMNKNGGQIVDVRKQTKEMCMEVYLKEPALAKHFDPLLFPEPPRKISIQEIVAAASSLTDDDKLELMRSIFGS